MKFRVAIVNCVFPPEPVVSAQMGRDLAEHLAGEGAQVTVLCPFPSRPIGSDYAALTARGASQIDYQHGVEIVRLPSHTAPRSTLWGRMRESFSFGRSVCRHLARMNPAPDVVYANTWPVLSQALIARYCARNRMPLAMHIQDLYPESLLARVPGVVRRIATAPLTRLDRWTTRHATRVIAISEEMRRTYLRSRRLDASRVLTRLNWADDSSLASLPPRSEACAHYGIDESPFTFFFLGNIGPVAGVEFLIEAFHSTQLSTAQLVIAGDGSAKASCVQQAGRLGAANVHFLSDPDAARVPLLQSLAHVCLLPMRRGTGKSSIPSKLMTYLFAAKPVLASVDEDSDTARCIRDGGCGWVSKPENTTLLSNRFKSIATLAEVELKRLGARGRRYGLEHFSKASGVRRLAADLRSMAGAPAALEALAA